ncbi:4857_t:CDS:2 [Cetraspora pellucida]|uniref:4857_t:CDS:1 n=1 Tax=Cetraspora pellucida TaxID=1433469 RepID=A0ACA9K432_9GLOM|nr:4857_t:CDS:2 [Cetraspora pellucida]
MQKRQISKLLAEKFTLCLLNKQTQKQLQNCEADKATLALVQGRTAVQLGANLRHGAVELEEIERYKAEQLSGAYLHSNSDLVSTRKTYNVDTNKLVITKTETEELVRNIIAFTQSVLGDKLKHSSQMEPSKIYRDLNLRLNDQEWLRIDSMTNYLSALSGPSTLQSLINTITKGVVDKFSSFLSKKNRGNLLVDIGLDVQTDLD